MTTRVAVVGAGISGLSAAYHLPDDVEVTVYEKEDRPGGHALTVEVEEDGRTIGIDTAFVVFNSRTYPQLSAFFQEIGATALDHTGGFDFFDLDRGLDYGTAEFELTEEEIAGRYPADFLPLWRDAERFHREAPATSCASAPTWPSASTWTGAATPTPSSTATWCCSPPPSGRCRPS